VVSWSLECAALFVLVHGFPGLTIAPLAAIFAYAAPTIVGALAMLPGGVGLTEVGMTGALLEVGGSAITRLAQAPSPSSFGSRRCGGRCSWGCSRWLPFAA
jgi:uncharacterized membrane protein YbhN (UPF0104 family)